VITSPPHCLHQPLPTIEKNKNSSSLFRGAYEHGFSSWGYCPKKVCKDIFQDNKKRLAKQVSFFM